VRRDAIEAPAMSPRITEELRATLGGTYTLERELGGGGMARVFVADEVALGRKVVIKVVAPDLIEGISAERFTREVRLAARLQQANIVPLLSAGNANGVPYYTMPFVDGLSLRARLTNGTMMTVGEASHILRDVAKALAYAHAQGVVHRDIKPENVLLSGGTAMVTDFGIAKALTASRTRAGAGEAPPQASTRLTTAGTSLGTPAYMAPEQVVGEAVDSRADLYAWGVMAYEMLTGAHPFADRTTAQQLVAAHLAEMPVPVDERNEAIPAPLADAVMRCLEKDAAQRPASASELLTALDSVSTPGAVIGAARTTGPRRVTAARARKRRWTLGVAGTAVIAALAGGGVWMMLRKPATVAAEKSLAVIPFETAGGDTANAYLAEGIADELSIALARLPELRLAGRSSVARFKGKGASAQEIGAALNVASVLDGTVRRAGNQLRVTAQLTNATDGLVLWSDRFDRQVNDVFALQDDITDKITSALRVRLGKNERVATTSAGVKTNPEANDLYLRALYLFRRRGAGLGQAAELLEQAIEKDSSFARAHAALALVLMSEPYYLPVRLRDVLPRARVAAERAVALEPTLADAHMALGMVHFHSFEFAPAEAESRRALALDPNSAEAGYRLGLVLLSTGRAAESIPVLERAKAIDPFYAVVAAYLAYGYALAGQLDAGVAEARRAVEIDSSLVWSQTALLYAYRAAGQPAEAVTFARRLVTQTDAPRRVGLAAYTLGRFGAPGEAKKAIARLEALPRDVPRRDAGLAYAYLGVGDTARALSVMERAASGDGDLLFALSPTDDTFDGVRASPRFAAIVKRLNFDVALVTRTQPR
jgi:TolB-like protein/tRNA A-37 threonylcarbamoyl transferase component Bud32/Tfp pilus assembly protein PilF